jgi:hypothetical protein
MTESFGVGKSDIYLLKTDSNGEEEWNRTFGGARNDIGYSVQETRDGGYIIVGMTRSSGATADVYLIKTYSNGTEQWTRTFGRILKPDFGFSVKETSDGGYIIVGTTRHLGIIINFLFGAMDDVYLIKTDSNGTEQWTRTFGKLLRREGGFSVEETKDGGYIIAGLAESFGATISKVYLIKTDSRGRKQWSRTFGRAFGRSLQLNIGYSVQQTSDGGYIITGYKYSYSFYSPVLSDIDVYLIKTDSRGRKQWSRTFGKFLQVDYSYSVRQTSDGGYIIVGYTHFPEFRLDSDVYLIKTDSRGKSYAYSDLSDKVDVSQVLQIS